MSQMPEWLVVVILGLIEGVTEFLPISSTGHMLLAQALMPHPQPEVFLAVIQVGAVLAVLTVFAGRLKELLVNWKEPANFNFLLKLAVAFGLTVVGGLALKKMNFKLPKEVGPIAWATLIGGILIIGIEAVLKGKKLKDEVTWPAAIAIGIGQLLAVVFPGSSRSGTTILMALALGVNRPRAAEFSFLLGIPTLLAAAGLEVKDALKGHEHVDWMMIALGSVVAAVTAFAVVKWLLRYVQNHTFTIFGWYRVAIGIAILLILKRH